MAWLTYAPNARYDPKSGAVQYNRGGNWQDIGNMKVDKTGRLVRTKSGKEGEEEVSGPTGWDWAMPSADQVRSMGWAGSQGGSQAQQQQAATATGGPLAGGNTGYDSYYSSNFGPGFTGDSSSGGAASGGATGGTSTVADTSINQPEQRALAQLSQIDPTSETLRQAVAQSYLTPLQQAGAPKASQFQSYLDLYRQIDPTGAAARESLGKMFYGQAQLGAQLDPSTIREVEQATRRAQGARGNIFGVPQLVQEAMQRGSAGEARRQQRQANLLSYLQSGQGMGDVAMNLYRQQQDQLRANQQGALSYLSSGQTPYQAGASYLANAENRAATAAQGGPQYNPSALGQGMTGTAQQFPQYGLDIGQQTENWYNSLNAYSGGGGGGGKNRALGAATGAIGGAASGALAGAAAGGVGAIPGAILGGIGGALSGYSG